MSCLNARRTILAIAVGLCAVFGGIPASTLASAPFADDFEGYSVANLNGQGSWISSGATVVSSPTHSGDRAASIAGAYVAYKIGDSTNIGDWVYYIGRNSSDWHNFVIRITPLVGGSPAYVKLECYGSGGCPISGVITYGGATYELYPSTSEESWYRVEVKWNSTTHQIQFCSTDSETCSEWYTQESAGDGWYSGITTFSFESDNVQAAYLDDIASGVIPYDDSIEITSPTSTPAYFNYYTLNYHIDSRRAGFGRADVWLCGGDVVSCEAECANGYVAEIEGNCWTSHWTSGCPSKDTFDNSINLWPYSASIYDGTIMNAKAYLLVADPEADPHCAFETGYTPPDSPRLVATSEESNVEYSNTPIITAGALEDCSELSGVDLVICHIKNFLIGAFLPSNEAIQQFQTTMGAFENKFPMNYLTAIASSTESIVGGVDDDASITISIMGHSGDVDTSFFSQDLGGGATLGGAIKLILTFVVFSVFFLWGRGYMHRLFV